MKDFVLHYVYVVNLAVYGGSLARRVCDQQPILAWHAAYLPMTEVQYCTWRTRTTERAPLIIRFGITVR